MKLNKNTPVYPHTFIFRDKNGDCPIGRYLSSSAGADFMPCPKQNCLVVTITNDFNRPALLEGDTIVCCPQQQIKNGDFVEVFLKNGFEFPASILRMEMLQP